MRAFDVLVLSAFLAAAPVLAAAQSSPAPVEKTDGLTAAEKLNQSIADANAAAAAKEAADLAAYHAAQAAVDQANRDSIAKHDAAVKANEEAAARAKAEFDAKNQAFQAQVAAQKAQDEANDRAFQAQLAAAQAAQAAYEQQLADYKACVAGDKTRCKS